MERATKKAKHEDNQHESFVDLLFDQETPPPPWYSMPSTWLMSYLASVDKSDAEARVKLLTSTREDLVPESLSAILQHISMLQQLANGDNEGNISLVFATLCDVMPEWIHVLSSWPVHDIRDCGTTMQGLRTATVEATACSSFAVTPGVRRTSIAASPTLNTLGSVPASVPIARATTPSADEDMDISDGEIDDDWGDADEGGGPNPYGVTELPILCSPADGERPLALEEDRYLYEPPVWRKTDVNQLRGLKSLRWYRQIESPVGLEFGKIALEYQGHGDLPAVRDRSDEWWCYDRGIVVLFSEFIDQARRRATGERLTRDIWFVKLDGGQKVVKTEPCRLRLWKARDFRDK